MTTPRPLENDTMNTRLKKKNTEDDHLIAQLKAILGFDPRKRFDCISCLAINGVQEIADAELRDVQGRTCLIVTMNRRPGHLNFGSGPMVTRGRLTREYAVYPPKDWTLAAPSPKWFLQRDGRWTRSYGGACVFGGFSSRVREAGPGCKWVKKGADGKYHFPSDVRKTKPAGMPVERSMTTGKITGVRA